MRARILIADDHPQVRRSLRLILESHEGWEVCAEAQDGRQAAVRALELKPDLIVLDFSMPELDGLNSARQILKTLPGVPIVIHSLFASAELERMAQEVGVRKVSSKGDTSGLIRIVESLLANPQTPPLTRSAGSASH